MKVGFLILNYNSWELCIKLGTRVSEYKQIDSVIIVDNCSTDDSYKHLEKICKDNIYIIKSEKNGGYAYGNNYGARYAKELGIDYLFISNPDVEVDEVDINKILDAFQRSDYAVLSGIEYDNKGNMLQPPIWKQMSYGDDIIDCFFIGRKLRKHSIGQALDESRSIQDAELVKGSFYAVKLDLFFDVGGLDENTFLFCEERILGKRMEIAGKKIGVVTNAKYYHNHSATINKAYNKVAQQMKMLYDSRLYYNKKYGGIKGSKLLVLRTAMKISLFEFAIYGRIKDKI